MKILFCLILITIKPLSVKTPYFRAKNLYDQFNLETRMFRSDQKRILLIKDIF